MSKSRAFSAEMLRHIFLNQAIANIGDATGLPGSATAGFVYATMHTADPGEVGTAATNETNYTGYARKALPRNDATFSVDDATAKLTIDIDVDFPKCTGGSAQTLTHFALVKQSSGESVVLYKGGLFSGATPITILVQAGVTPRLEGTPSGTSTSITED